MPKGFVVKRNVDRRFHGSSVLSKPQGLRRIDAGHPGETAFLPREKQA